MISDRDIDMCARALVEMFGKDAPARAGERGAEYPEDADDSRTFWKRIELTTEAVLKEKPGDVAK